MNSFLKDFYRDERGAMAAIIVLMLFVLLGFGALAIDMSFAGSTRTELQVTASSAAMAGVQSINEADPTDSEYREAAVEFTYRNMPGAGNGNLVEADCGTYDGSTVTSSTECSDVKVGQWEPATTPGARGTFTAHDDGGFDPLTMNYDAVRVRAHRSQERDNPLSLFLAPVVGLAETDVNVSAIAWAETTDLTSCLIALNETEDQTFHVQGNADVTSDSCAICVNSTSPDGFYMNGSPVVDLNVDGEDPAGNINLAAGEWTGHKGNWTINPDPAESINFNEPCGDPLKDADTWDHVYGRDCDVTDLHLTAGDKNADGEFVIPGDTTYCGGIKITASGPVIFEDGFHHIKDGELEFDGTHDFFGGDPLGIGEGITFVCENCTLDFGGSQVVDFNAGAIDPATGENSLFLVYDRSFPPPDDPHRFRGDAQASYEGVIYAPYADVESYGNSGADETPPECFAVIADKFLLTGNSGLNVNSDGCGGALDQIAVEYRLVD